MFNDRPSSGDRARIRRAMRTSRRQTTGVSDVPPLPSPSNVSSAVDPLRSQSQPPSGDAWIQVGFMSFTDLV